jgi:hypothetical protein
MLDCDKLIALIGAVCLNFIAFPVWESEIVAITVKENNDKSDMNFFVFQHLSYPTTYIILALYDLYNEFAVKTKNHPTYI